MPKWRDRDDAVSNFMEFVAVLTDQIDARSEAELDMEVASSAKEAASLLSPVQVYTACAHESVGRMAGLGLSDQNNAQATARRG